MEDAAIVALYWQRSEAAISESETKYGAYCGSIAYNILENREDTEECVADTWLRAWNSMPPQKPGRLRLFLGKITRNLSFNRWRDRHAKKRGGIDTVLEELDECVSGGATPAQEAEFHELCRAVEDYLRLLPERECGLFVGRYFYAEPIGSLAERFGLSRDNVSVILTRTRKRLRVYLEKEGLI